MDEETKPGAKLRGGMDPTVAAPSLAPTQPESLIGQTLAERYRIEKRIGAGGMGVVYLATHTLLEKQVALKVLHRDLARRPDIAERFVQEARAASRIHDEHVIDISDFGVADGVVFFAMELLRGRDLQDELDAAPGHRLPYARSKNIVLQVCSALASAHAAGIVHRDLKPSNVYLIEFLGKPDFVKLLDFGIAKRTELAAQDQKLTNTGMVFGTPQYMAPEQARGLAADHRVDVYAMGCILYQLITGQVPYTGANFMGVLSKHLTDPVPQIAPEAFEEVGAPAALASVIARALAKDRDERYQTIDELADAIRQVSGDAAVTRRLARKSSSPPPPMPAERWQRIEDLFDRALAISAADRDAFLERECQGDEALRADVAELLANSEGATDSLRKVIREAAADMAVERSDRRIGKRLGPYRLVRRLGEGGMGIVYLAERDDGQYQRTVAIKVLPHELGSARLIARFRDERQILARLDHTGIVRLFDGGTTDEGQPYLVMEYIEGAPLTEYATANELSVRSRVELVAGICGALQYAHQQQVIHRDIKPSNILVNRDGVPKLLDFGIAKFSDGSAREARTRTGAAPFTPQYASPEQARGEPVTAASDIYSLGAVLYELLCGRPPHVDKGDTLETLRGICEVDPPRPSRVAPASLRKDITSALDAVVMTALQKSAARRYPTMDALHDDLRRFLANDRVNARTPRRRAPILLAGGVVAGICAGAWALVRPHPTGASHAPVEWHVALDAHDARGSADAWLAVPLQRIATRQLRDLVDRRFSLVDDKTADHHVELVYRVAPTGVQIDAALEGPTGTQPIGSATAASVVEAVAELREPIQKALDAPASAPRPDPAEQREMKQLGTSSLEAFRRYRALRDEFLGATWVDAPSIAKRLDRVTELDPGWAHGWALLAIVQGRVTTAASTTLERARAAIDQSRDRGGQLLLEGLRKTVSGDNPAAFDVLDGALHEDPDDVLLGWMMSGLSADRVALDETLAILRQFYALRPDLQFGGDLAHTLRIAGRRDEAAVHSRAWADAYPESEQALIELALVSAEDGDNEAAKRAVERMILIHGESSERLASQCEVLLLSGKLGAAREVAEKLLLGDKNARARARYRLGIVAVFEGRFAVAYEALRQAAEEATPLGAESELTQILEALRGLAGFMGQPGDYRRFTMQLASAQRQFGMYSTATQFELDMLDRGNTCPASAPLLADVPDGPPRDTFRRYMLRVAADHECASCKDVVRAGFASNEQSAASLLEFGRCAVKEGELELAKQAMQRATLLSVSFIGPQASPYHAILARFELARVLVRLGERDAARKQYEAFLGYWGSSDRPVAEVALARKELEALGDSR